MGGGGAAVQPRSAAENAAVPVWADAAVDVGAGLASAMTVAPILMTFDKAVTQAAAGAITLTSALASGFKELLRRPHLVVTRLPYWMVVGVYGSTYATANLIDSACERLLDPASDRSAMMHGGAKLVGTTAVNMSASVAKDASFARMYGTVGSKAKMPFASLGLFAGRDILTIGAAFTVPQLVAASLVSSGAMDQAHASEAAQMLSPVGMQLFCTPLHLAALNRFNFPSATLGERLANVASLAPSSTLARMARMAPAYGIGGLMNTKLTLKWRDDVLHHYMPPPTLEPVTPSETLGSTRQRARAQESYAGAAPNGGARHGAVGFGHYPSFTRRLSA